MKSVEELLPCPFCGADSEIDYRHSFRAYVSGKILTGISITCTKCPAVIHGCKEDYPDITPEWMISLWNARAIQTSENYQKGYLDALEKDISIAKNMQDSQFTAGNWIHKALQDHLKSKRKEFGL